MLKRSVSLLIVEDDDVDREILLRSLRRANLDASALTAENGHDALEILRGTADGAELGYPYIVILDWKMPRMNGLEFLRAIRADPDLRDAVVFVLTTSRDERDLLAAHEHLVAGYIVKENAGERFGEVVDLIDRYSRLVELPVRQAS